ncbi:hypothetical protein ACHQM5_010297 [Ranunculus cassubicifolius]
MVISSNKSPSPTIRKENLDSRTQEIGVRKSFNGNFLTRHSRPATPANSPSPNTELQSLTDKAAATTRWVITAYLLAVLGGNTELSADDLKKILGPVGADAEDDRLELLLSQVKGKDITELIASGREKLASVPSGGAGGAPIAVAASGAGGGAAPAAAEAKKEEKVEEKEESDDDMGLSLFD